MTARGACRRHLPERRKGPFVASAAGASLRWTMTDPQSSLLEPPADAAPAPQRRRSSKGIAPGDIVEIDKKGRRFHALVETLDQSDSGRFELEVRPLVRGVSYRRATVREVVGVWRKVK